MLQMLSARSWVDIFAIIICFFIDCNLKAYLEANQALYESKYFYLQYIYMSVILANITKRLRRHSLLREDRK